MAIREASVAKAASDASKPVDNEIFNTLIASAIDAKIGSVSEDTDTDIYVAYFTFPARIENKVCQIEQSDRSYINLDDIVNALKSRSHRVSYQIKNLRVGIKVQLSVAWD